LERKKGIGIYDKVRFRLGLGGEGEERLEKNTNQIFHVVFFIF
jgi:hypothetical protein